MKLNYRNTFYIGLVFFTISLFWQTYDMMIARTLIDKYGLNQTWSGVVMAIDNVMAVILLPLFGSLSDRSNAKLGRRTPYIIVGTVLAAFAFMALAYSDYQQTLLISETDIVEYHYNAAFSQTVDASETSHWYIVVDHMTEERTQSYNDGFISYRKLMIWEDNIKDPIVSLLNANPISMNNRDLSIVKDLYYKYLSERAWEVTVANPANLTIFISILFVALVSMAIYRSPAVALMPDITIKPLRSKANSIIALMGAFGGILAVYIIMISGLNKNAYDHHFAVYIIIGIIMLLTLGIFLWKVSEPKMVEERKQLEIQYGMIPGEIQQTMKNGVLPTFERRLSLYVLLLSVFLLFTGYNAVMSKLADYLPKVLNLNFFDYQFIIAQVLVIAAILPVGILSMRLGRKKTVLLGMVLLASALSGVVFLKENQAWLTASMIALAGLGWTMISVNLYVMVVELSKGADVGRYTGYYYSASMTAQIITPILSGYLMDTLVYGRLILFPYATLFVVLSLIAMLFVKHSEGKKFKSFKDVLSHEEDTL
jgi:MFS family permease